MRERELLRPARFLFLGHHNRLRVKLDPLLDVGAPHMSAVAHTVSNWSFSTMSWVRRPLRGRGGDGSGGEDADQLEGWSGWKRCGAKRVG